MQKIFIPLGLSLMWFLAFNSIVNAPAQANIVSDERFGRLAKGLNIARWFWQNKDQSDDHYQTYMSDDELEQIRDAGFTHVRLVITSDYVLNESDPGAPDAKHLAFIKGAVKRITAHDLAVVINIHASPGDFNTRLMNDPDMQQDYAAMWRALASYMSDTNPDMVFLEVLNEYPGDPAIWSPIQEKVVKAMRQGAPEHTIIARGPDRNSINGLKILKSLDDANVIYNFHFYDPFYFTHQGADWAGDVQYLHDIVYPSTNGRCGKLPDFGNPNANDWAQSYCTQGTWDAQRIDQTIQAAYTWAKQYAVRLTCNEFGVNPLVAPPDDRLQWFTDVRTVLEKYNIGWAVWGYDDGMGFDYHPNQGMSTLDPDLLKALGLSES